MYKTVCQQIADCTSAEEVVTSSTPAVEAVTGVLKQYDQLSERLATTGNDLAMANAKLSSLQMLELDPDKNRLTQPTDDPSYPAIYPDDTTRLHRTQR